MKNIMESGQKRAESSCKPQSILVVEKSSLTRKLIADVLNNAGYTVIAAVDAQDAMSKLNDVKLDLILTDVNVSVIDLLQKLRENPKSRFTPVALLVDKPDNTQRKSEPDSINQWIEKPFTPASLIESIKKFI